MCITFKDTDTDNHKHTHARTHARTHTHTHRLTHCHQIVSCPGGMCVATAEPEMRNWEFSWAQDVIYILRNTSILCSIPSLWSFPNVTFEPVPMFISNQRFTEDCQCQAHTLYTSLLQGLGGVVLGFVPAGSAPSSSTLQTFWDAVLETVALPASLYTRSFLLTPKCPEQYICRCLQRWLPNCDTCKSGIPIPLFVACSLDLWGGGCVVWLWPLDAIHQRACMTASASFSSWR